MDEENLWGKLPVDDKLATPVSILKQQAIVLEKLTGGLLTGRVTTAPVSLNGESMILHTFSIVAPALSNYSVDIARVFHPPTLYPVKVKPLQARLPAVVNCVDEAAFKKELTEVFQDEELHLIIRSLLAQVRDEPGAGRQSRKSASD